MSSRRTRSGASLGNSEPRRLRRTPVRRQQVAKSSEEINTHHNSGLVVSHSSFSSTILEQSSKETVEEHELLNTKSKQISPKKIQISCSNIWERMAKNEEDPLDNATVQRAENETQDHASAKVATRISSSDTSTTKKNRKPEILVSLLEGEAAYPISHRRDSIGFESTSNNAFEKGVDSLNKYGEKAIISVGAAISTDEKDTFNVSPSSVCFFHNCECHRKSGLTDFSSMPDVPGEPFFVSLSKDENKELNMVKTVRVGCNLHKFVDHSHTYAEFYAKPSLFSATEKSKTVRSLSETSSSEERNVKRSSRCLYPSDMRSHRAYKDLSLNKENQKTIDSVTKRAEHKTTIIEHMNLNKNSDNFKCLSSESSWHVEKNIVDGNKSAHFQTSDISQDRKKISEVVKSERGDMNTSHYKSPTPCRSSQYPLMKEILIQQNYLPLSSTVQSSNYVAQSSELQSDTSDKQSFNTFNPSCNTVSSLSSMLVTNEDHEKNKLVKRSERIRCKSGTQKPCNIVLHQSVISTMKPADTTFKVKQRSQNLKRKSKVSFSRESHRKKSKKECEEEEKAALSKGSKDFVTNKATMSQEVMEAIIQSIEATVSGCTEKKNSDSAVVSTPLEVCSSDYTSHQNTTTSTTNTPRESAVVEHWPDSRLDHDYNISSSTNAPSHSQPSNSSASISKDNIVSNGNKKASKVFNSKKSSRKARKTSKTINKIKSLKVRSARPKIKPLTITTMIDENLPSDTGIYSTTADSFTKDEAVTASTSTTTEIYSGGKRFRKKTRKAKEAFGEDAVFCEDNWPVKKCKSRNRSGNTSSDSSSCCSQRRLRRSTQAGGQGADPLLQEHAFILWASENRSQFEQQHPGTSTSEVDTLLFSRWCEVTESVKAKFFLRAREAFSDDDRNMLRSSPMTDLEATMIGDFFNEGDPVFTDFIRLPIDRQRDMLRKWLKFFQKTLAKKEYIDFIITFKQACNRGTGIPSSRSKKTRMRCLDPSHYKMLFDMIRLTKPRVLEVYKTKRDKDKAKVSDSYSTMLFKLVRNEPLSFMEPGCKSQMLTEVLQDLGIPDKLETSSGLSLGTYVVSFSASDSITVQENVASGYSSNEESVNTIETTPTTFEWRSISDIKVPVTVEITTDPTAKDFTFDDNDYRVLNSDLALSLLSGLSELQTSELPVIDQATLDQVFLAPPRISTSFNQHRQAVNLYGRHPDTNPQNLVPIVSCSSPCSSPCLQQLLPSDPKSYQKVNIHYSPSTVSSCGSMVHHLPPKHTNAVPQKYTRRVSRESSPVCHGWCRKNSPIDMHANSTTLENMIQSPVRYNGTHSKCFKVHTKVMSPQIKLSLQPLQLPINTRNHQQNKHHPRVLPVSCGLQQRFPTIVYSPTDPALLDKLNPHHLNHLGAQPLTSSSATSSRMSPQHMGLSTPSPLITSLSPLRGVKYSHNSKSFSPHCQMVPYRPRMSLTSGSSSSHRRTPHTIPISTTHKTSNLRGHGSMQQIKVCLSTQTLKIPIAKLREPRKTSYFKGKVKNCNVQTDTVDPCGNLSCSQVCQFSSFRASSSSVLAKVLNIQAINKMEHLTKMSLSDGLSTSTVSSSRPINSTFIGTMRPVTVSTSGRSTSQLQLVSRVSNPLLGVDIKTVRSPQNAKVVNQQTMNRSTQVAQPCHVSTVHSLANISGMTAQNVNLSSTSCYIPVKNMNNLWETQEFFGANVIPESDFMNPVFQDSLDNIETSAEFRVVGTRTIGFTDTRESISNNYDPILVQNPDSSVYSTVCSHITSPASVSKILPDDVKTFDSDTKVFVHGHNQERCKGEMAFTKTVSAFPCSSQHLLHRGPSLVNKAQGTLQTSPRSFLIDSGDNGSNMTYGYVSQDIGFTTMHGHGYHDPQSIPMTTCELSNTQQCLSQIFVAGSSLVRKDVPGHGKCVTCEPVRDKGHCAKEPSELPTYGIESKITNIGGDYVHASNSLVESNDQKDGYETKVIADFNSIAGVSKHHDISCVDISPQCNLASNNADSSRNIDSTDSLSCYETRQSCLDSTDNMSDVTLERNVNALYVCRQGRKQEFCEHEYSLNSSREVMKWSMPTSVPSSCTAGAPGLHILAESATSIRSLLSSRRIIYPANQSSQSNDDDVWLSKKLDNCDDDIQNDPGSTIQKTTICAITVKSENQTSQTKNGNHLQKGSLDLQVSSSNSCRAANSPSLATQKLRQEMPSPASTVDLSPPVTMPLPSRTTVLASSVAHNNTANQNEASHSSLSVDNSQNACQKGSHYVNKYMPT